MIIILLWIFILNQIVLFGAEFSKVYASTLGPHPKQHLPPGRVERLFATLEEAEEIIEAATGKIDEASDEKIETSQAEAVAEKPQEPEKENN